jgi:hypothetical protein
MRGIVADEPFVRMHQPNEKEKRNTPWIQDRWPFRTGDTETAQALGSGQAPR